MLYLNVRVFLILYTTDSLKSILRFYILDFPFRNLFAFSKQLYILQHHKFDDDLFYFACIHTFSRILDKSM